MRARAQRPVQQLAGEFRLAARVPQPPGTGDGLPIHQQTVPILRVVRRMMKTRWAAGRPRRWIRRTMPWTRARSGLGPGRLEKERSESARRRAKKTHLPFPRLGAQVGSGVLERQAVPRDAVQGAKVVVLGQPPRESPSSQYASRRRRAVRSQQRWPRPWRLGQRQPWPLPREWSLWHPARKTLAEPGLAVDAAAPAMILAVFRPRTAFAVGLARVAHG